MISIPIAKLDNIDSRQPIFLCNEILEKRMDRSFYYIRKRNAWPYLLLRARFYACVWI